MPEDHLPARKRLHHDVPHWVEDGSPFFITVNCAERGSPQLTLPAVATRLLESARCYHDQGRWHLTLLLLMPDHFHAILSFPRDAVMAEVMRNWKRYTSRALGIRWQDGFFDHRLRNAEEETAKHHYIRHNPVRKNLCQRPEDWPHQMHWTQNGLAIGG
jgi:REP element-mobilizing transposase RayT